MDSKNLLRTVATLEFLSALLFPGPYTMLMSFYGTSNYWKPSEIAMNLLGLSFLLLPLLGVIGTWKGWRTTYIWMGLYPVIAFLFGIVPIPFANYLYSHNHELNAIFIGTTDMATIALVVWLYTQSRKGPDDLAEEE